MMEVLTQKRTTKHVEIVIDKLVLAQNIYDKSAQKVHFDSMKELFGKLRDHKQKQLIELSEMAEIDLDEYSVSTKELIKLELEKIGIELDHLTIQNNYNETLSFCINRENELYAAYLQAIEEKVDDMELEKLLRHHADNTKLVLDKLVERHAKGDFKNW